MDSPDSQHIEKLPAWVEEEFLRQIRRGTVTDVSGLINSLASQLPETRETVIHYLQLLAFTEAGALIEQDVAPALPQFLGQYQVQRLIGRGGMGMVVAARAPDGGLCAIKILNPQRDALLDRFQREARTLAELDHPGIVNIREFHNDAEPPYLVMDFINGISLDQLLHSSPEYAASAPACSKDADHARSNADRPEGPNLIASDFATIAHIGEQLGDALAYTHRQGIVHRDIKPANIIYSDDGCARVTDFGLARHIASYDSVTQTGDIVGTPRYMAPEQLRGVADERSDIYSLGVTLWELCTGHCAWVSPVERQPSGWQLPPARDIQPDVPRGMSELISECCAFDPDRRPRADQVAVRMAQIYNSELAPTRPAILSRPILIAGVCGLLIALFTAASMNRDAFLRPADTPPNALTRPVSNFLPATSRQIHVQVRDGQTSLDLREILPDTRHLKGLTARIVGGRDADCFRIDLDSQLCARTPDVCLAENNRTLEVQLLVSECDQPTWAACVEYTDNDVCFMSSDGRQPRFFRLPDANDFTISQSVGLASVDGSLFLTTLPAADGKLALWSFVISQDDRLVNPRCLSPNCKLPSGTEAFATTDGRLFHVVGYSEMTNVGSQTGPGRLPRSLWTFALQDDGTFRQLSERRLQLETDHISHLFITETGILRLGWLVGGMHTQGWIDKTATDTTPVAFGNRIYDTQARADWKTDSFRPVRRVTLHIRPTRWDEMAVLRASRLDGTRRTINLVNTTAQKLHVFWVNAKGQQAYVTQIPANSPWQLDTYVGHTLEIHDATTIWSAFTVCEQMPVITLDGPGKIPVRDYAGKKSASLLHPEAPREGPEESGHSRQ